MGKRIKIEWNTPSEGIKIKQIADSIDLAIETLRQIEDLKLELKENFKEINEETGIPRRVWNAGCKAKMNFDSAQTIKENQDVIEFLEILVDNV